jgi:hypothetical protein
MRRHIKVDRIEVRASGVTPEAVAAALRGLGPALQQRLAGGSLDDDGGTSASRSIAPLRVGRDPQPRALAADLAARVAHAIARTSDSHHTGGERP